MGIFTANGPPELNIVPTAWGGKFGAQVRVVPAQTPVAVVKLEAKMGGGAKSVQEVCTGYAWFA